MCMAPANHSSFLPVFLVCVFFLNSSTLSCLAVVFLVLGLGGVRPSRSQTNIHK